MNRFSLPKDRPAIMGVLNVTPDSFSDGGQHFDPATAIEAGLRMVAEGADIVDVGGESTRPNAEEVAIEEELRRVLPVVSALAAKGVVVSIDTRKAEVAKQCLGAGAQIVNDVSGLRDPKMVKVCVKSGCIVCIMHMRETPETMQDKPYYENVVSEVRSYLLKQARKAEALGIKHENVWIDPGIGFGKTVEHNVLLLRHLQDFVGTGFPVLIGVSRKSFLGKLVNPEDPLPVQDRQEATLAAEAWCQLLGAKIIRTHDVKALFRSSAVLKSLTSSRLSG